MMYTFKILILNISFMFALTSIDLSNRMVIDGESNEFELNEFIFLDSLGTLLEYPADSYWGEYNDIKQLKVTWDEAHLYLALDACSYDNNVILFIDIYNDYGINDMSNLNAWQRAFKFYNINPDFFIATWDTNNSPQFWKVQEGGSIQVDLIPNVETYSTYNAGNLNASMEIKIPWEVLYFRTEILMQNNPKIKLVSVITSGDDQGSGPDVAPDNLGGMVNAPIVIDNYAEILIDSDYDNYPDMEVSPQSRTSFFKKPPFEPITLKVNEVIFTGGRKIFSPKDDVIEFELISNRLSEFHVEIFDLDGKFIDYATQNNNLYWQWDGKMQNGEYAPFGIYILHFVAESGELSHKESLVFIK